MLATFRSKFLALFTVLLLLLAISQMAFVLPQQAAPRQALGGPAMTPDLLASVAAIILSLVFSYFPGLRTWFAAKEEGYKQLLMLGLLVVVAAGTFGLACAGLLTDLFGLSILCDRAGAISLVQALIWAALANQGAYAFSPKTKDVKAIKAAKKAAAEQVHLEVFGQG